MPTDASASQVVTAAPSRTLRVFVSYSWTNKCTQRGLVEALQARPGITVVDDTGSVRDGARIEGALVEAISSSALCVLWSRSAASSGWVLDEIRWHLAARRRRGEPAFVVVARLDETPFPLIGAPVVDVSERPTSVEIDRLEALVRSGPARMPEANVNAAGVRAVIDGREVFLGRDGRRLEPPGDSVDLLALQVALPDGDPNGELLERAAQNVQGRGPLGALRDVLHQARWRARVRAASGALTRAQELSRAWSDSSIADLRGTVAGREALLIVAVVLATAVTFTLLAAVLVATTDPHDEWGPRIGRLGRAVGVSQGFVLTATVAATRVGSASAAIIASTATLAVSTIAFVSTVLGLRDLHADVVQLDADIACGLAASVFLGLACAVWERDAEPRVHVANSRRAAARSMAVLILTLAAVGLTWWYVTDHPTHALVAVSVLVAVAGLVYAVVHGPNTLREVRRDAVLWASAVAALIVAAWLSYDHAPTNHLAFTMLDGLWTGAVVGLVVSLVLAPLLVAGAADLGRRASWVLPGVTLGVLASVLVVTEKWCVMPMVIPAFAVGTLLVYGVRALKWLHQ